MRSAIRAVTIAQVLLVCPVLFTACNGRHAPSGPVQPVSTSSTATSPDAAKVSEALAVRHVDAQGARKALDEDKKVVVLDVRTAEEFGAGHVAGASNLDFNSPGFAENLAKLDRDTTYLVHCAAGGRSTRSLARFKELGFKSVIHLDGGFNGWVQAGLPVAK